MKPQKKRIALTVPDDLDQVISQISELTSMPKTAVILDLVQSAMPMMLQTVQALQQAKAGNKESAMDVMAGLLKDAGFQLDEVQHDFFQLKKSK